MRPFGSTFSEVICCSRNERLRSASGRSVAQLPPPAPPRQPSVPNRSRVNVNTSRSSARGFSHIGVSTLRVGISRAVRVPSGIRKRPPYCPNAIAPPSTASKSAEPAGPRRHDCLRATGAQFISPNAGERRLLRGSPAANRKQGSSTPQWRRHSTPKICRAVGHISVLAMIQSSGDSFASRSPRDFSSAIQLPRPPRSPSMKTTCCLTLALVTASVLPAAAQNGKPDSEGFVRDWLVLAPHSIGDSSGADEIDKKQFATEEKPAAKDGTVQRVAGKDLMWAKVTSPTFYIDFKELHPDKSEHVLAWAVAYIVAPVDKTGLTLKMNS